ncbi:mediator of RNA polymerase II transcription subunit 30-like isoform X5 [Tachysurus fulvidraco]|uniref:mediator of RNA polymerase II transcription subunit 30-like isoform X5 n=1 Tax=Tachysurus fulvidraco TaxID=1234273 RepID=UPI001FEFC428|nr:mediator of RNA polymerase II transcription subunit 30-like isoform X5 [Tachysurus fulvidraco]XP_047663723.1 mediator of RNA polymerase II transcription subunit 30-like isoform X5 [Tachysurus fulvidraco]
MSSLPQKAPGGGLGGVPLQQQQQQQQNLLMGASSGASVPGQAAMPPNSAALREISPVFLCRIGQDTVQDIVTRTMEIFQITRATQLPNGVTQSQAAYQDRFGKLQEHLRQLTLLFRKLRLLYERCVEMTSDLQESPAEVRYHQSISWCRMSERRWLRSEWSTAVLL